MTPVSCSPRSFIRGAPLVCMTLLQVGYQVLKAVLTKVVPLLALVVAATVYVSHFMYGNFLLMVLKTYPQLESNPLSIGIAQVTDIVLLTGTVLYIGHFLLTGLLRGFTSEQKDLLRFVFTTTLWFAYAVSTVFTVLSYGLLFEGKVPPTWVVYARHVGFTVNVIGLAYFFVRWACLSGQRLSE